MLWVTVAFGQKDRTVKIFHDNNQTDRKTKVYYLKHALSNDITTFVGGAGRRNNPNARVSRINHDGGKTQMLVVSMDPNMIPYIDAMIKVLDHSAPKDSDGSTIKNAGAYSYVYRPIHRSSTAMFNVINSGIWKTNDTALFRDSKSNLFSWKGAPTAAGIASWLKALDRPIPQVRLTMTVYTINDNDLKEIGFDYVTWKNGPGKNFLGFGVDFFSADVSRDLATDGYDYGLSNRASNTGGNFSPQIDLSFIRMMALKGKAKVQSAGSVVVKNDYAGSVPANFSAADYRISYKPNYHSISKDGSDNLTVTDSSNIDYELYFTQPTVTFPSTTGKINYTCAAGFSSGFNLAVSSEIGKTTDGTPIIDSQSFSSSFVMVCEQEKLLATFTKNQDTEHYSGIPFLSSLPGCKNIFGSTITSRSKAHMLVTLIADPIVPDQDITEADYEIIKSATEMNIIKNN